MWSFCRAANLRAIIRHHLLPDGLSSFYKTLEAWLGTKYNGALRRENDAMNSKPTWLVFPRTGSQVFDVEKFLYSTYRVKSDAYMWEMNLLTTVFGPTNSFTVRCSHLFHRAATYEAIDFSTKNEWKAGKNSFVQFKFQGTIATGRILMIVRANGFREEKPERVGDDVRILVEKFAELSELDATRDPYRYWTHLGSRLVYTRFTGVISIQVDDLISHVARTPWKGHGLPSGESAIVISSLDRVRCGHSVVASRLTYWHSF